MDVMRGLGERGDSTPLAGVENLMLHFTPYSEDWSKLPVIVSGEGSYVTDDKGSTYIDGLAGLFTTQVGHGRTELADAAHKQMKELGFFPNWSFQHPETRTARSSSRLVQRRWRPSSSSPGNTTRPTASRDDTRSYPGTSPTTAPRWARYP